MTDQVVKPKKKYPRSDYGWKKKLMADIRKILDEGTDVNRKLMTLAARHNTTYERAYSEVINKQKLGEGKS